MCFSAMQHYNKDQAKEIHTGFDRAREKGVVKFSGKPSKPLSEEGSKLLADGFIVLENVLSVKTCLDLRNEIDRIASEESTLGRNAFEGRGTRRPYGILGKSRM